MQLMDSDQAAALTRKDEEHVAALGLKDEEHKAALGLKDEEHKRKDGDHAAALTRKDEEHAALKAALTRKDGDHAAALTRKDDEHAAAVLKLENGLINYIEQHKQTYKAMDQSNKTLLDLNIQSFAMLAAVDQLANQG